MAGRILNRHALREQTEQAEQRAAAAADTTAVEAPPKKKGRVKTAAAPGVKKPRKAKARARICARWGIFDGGMKQVAIFDFNQRAAADDKLADLRSRNKGVHFLQIVKEPMPEPAPGEVPSAP